MWKRHPLHDIHCNAIHFVIKRHHWVAKTGSGHTRCCNVETKRCVCVRVCVFCAQRYRPIAEEFRDAQETFWAEFARSFKQLTEAGMPPLPLPLPLPPVAENDAT